MAGSVHAVKSLAVRPAVTATTAGAGNVPVSIAEDLVSTALVDPVRDPSSRDRLRTGDDHGVYHLAAVPPRPGG